MNDEAIYVVAAVAADCFDAVIRLARTYAQKTILAVDSNRIAHLVFVSDGKQQYQGHFTNVKVETAKKSKSWTKRAGQYYVCQI